MGIVSCAGKEREGEKIKRDVGVEFLRIIACVIVIGTHVKL